MKSEDRACEQIKRLLPDYSVGAIAPRDRRVVDKHIGHCSECSSELKALEQTAALLDHIPLEEAPDLWYAIRPSLASRPARHKIHDILVWLGGHRYQSAIAATVATAAISAWVLVTPPQQPSPEAKAYLAHHASLSWREPFADKAGLGLADSAYVNEKAEATR